MATVMKLNWNECIQTSVDPTDKDALEIVITLSKAFVQHHCHLWHQLDQTKSHLQRLELDKPLDLLETLNRVGDEVERKHNILFDNMLKRLSIVEQSQEQVIEMLKRVFDELFGDNHYNWGRIVTVFVFGACVSKCLMPKQPELAETVAEFVGETVHKRAGKWISSEGGWEAFVDFFRVRDSFEDSLWKGLKFTLLGLGTLAFFIKD